MKNFEIFFDVHMDTSVIENYITKNFEIFYFWAQTQTVTKKFFVAKILV